MNIIKAALPAAALVFLTPTILLAQTPAATAPAAAPYSASSKIGDLLDNAATKAVLQKYIPEVIASEQIGMARGMTLEQLAGYPQVGIDEAKMKTIVAELAAIK